MLLLDGGKLDCTVYAWRWHFINTAKSRKAIGSDLPKLLPGMRTEALNKGVCRQQWEKVSFLLIIKLMIKLVSLQLPLVNCQNQFPSLKPKRCTQLKCGMPLRGICVSVQDNFLNSRLDFSGILHRWEWGRRMVYSLTKWNRVSFPVFGLHPRWILSDRGLGGRSTITASCGPVFVAWIMTSIPGHLMTPGPASLFTMWE